MSDTRDNRKTAMEPRTTINPAVGVIMGQNRCSLDDAVTMPRDASGTRNVKLREIAPTIIATLNHGKTETPFDEKKGASIDQCFSRKGVWA